MSDYKPVLDNVLMALDDIVRQSFPDAFCAGGYLRDKYLGLNPKDIDFFTFCEPLSPDADCAVATYEGVPRFHAISRFTGPNDMRVEIIHLNDEEFQQENRAIQVVNNFALGIQQIFDQGGVLARSFMFIEDVRNKTLTVSRCSDESDAASVAYKIQTLKKREFFKDFTVIVPPAFKAYEHILLSYEPEAK